MTLELSRTSNGPAAILTRIGGSALLVALGRLAFLGFFAVAARFSSTAAFGEFATSLALAQILAVPATLGSAPAAQAILPSARPRLAATFLRFSATATMLGTAAIAFGLSAVAHIAPIGNLATMAQGALWLLPGIALGTWREFIARSAGHLRLSLLPRDVIWTLACIVAILALPQFGDKLLIGAAILLLTIEITASAILVRKLGYSPSRAPFRAYRRWRNRSLALLLNNTGGQLLDRFDIFIVGLLFSLDTAALYAVANRLAPLASLSQRFIIPALSAPIARAMTHADWPDMRENLRLGVSLGAAYGGIVLLLISVAGPLILGLHGAPYLAAFPLLLILSLGQACTAIGSTFGLIVSLGPRSWDLARLIWLTAIPAFGLAYLAGTQFGAIGVAITAATAVTTYNILIARTALRTLGPT